VQIVDRYPVFSDNKDNQIKSRGSTSKEFIPFRCFSFFEEKTMKPNDVVFTKENLEGKVKRVITGSDNVIVEFTVPIDKKRKIKVTSKMSRRSLRRSKEK